MAASLSLPRGNSDHIEFSPEVEALGLGAAYRNRLKKARVTPPRNHNKASPVASASSNKVSDTAIAVVAGQTEAPITSGASGARIDQSDEKHIAFFIRNASIHMPMDRHAHASSSHVIGNNAKLPGCLGPVPPLADEIETTSEIAASIHTSNDATDTEVSVNITDTTYSRDTRKHLASSTAVIDIGERQMTPPPLMTIEEYSTMFKEMICKITEAYEVVPPLVRKFSTSSKRCERQKDLRLQEQALLARSEKIQDVLSLGTAKKLRYKELLRAACYRIYTRLSQLQDCLRNLQLYAENNFRRDGQIVKPDIKSRRVWASWLTNWYEELIEAFRNYEKATDELIKRQIRPQQPDNSLEQLSSDARTTSQFKKCLCRVCPEGCHNYHTAYLSLEPDNLGNARGISAAGSPTARTEGNPVIIWQCDMAFKSTVTKRDTLIWLKVKSNMNTVSHPPSNIASSLCTSFDNDEASNTELQKPHAIADRPSRKHRASSMPPEPASKALKTHLGQSHSDTDPAVGIASRIELCPEFLAQHDATEHAVMKMADSSGCQHSIFYLAQEERSMYGAKSITLDELLRSRHEAKHRSFLGGLFSKLRLARVIAEAMLRFDLRDSDRAPEKSIFVHGLSAKRTAGYSVTELAPFSVDAMKPGLFLAITLEKQQQQCIATVPSAGSLGASSIEGAGKAAGRASVLVNLGMILLRIGTERDDQLDHAPMGSEQMREFISANAEKTQINPLYADAVRACAWFFEDDDVTTDEVFRDRFFSKIVQPLKFCERLILQDREKGRV